MPVDGFEYTTDSIAGAAPKMPVMIALCKTTSSQTVSLTKAQAKARVWKTLRLASAFLSISNMENCVIGVNSCSQRTTFKNL